MDFKLSELRELLEKAHGIAVDSLDSKELYVLTSTFLGYRLSLTVKTCTDSSVFYPSITVPTAWGDRALDLDDKWCIAALRIALALSLGLDPTDGVIWQPTVLGWTLVTSTRSITFTKSLWAANTDSRRIRLAPAVAEELNSTQSLVLACKHILGGANG